MTLQIPQENVLAFLRKRDSFPHDAHCCNEVETNQSHVFLVGDYAYKLFKAISRYRDNTSPEARLENARLEMDANRHMAKELYLGIYAVVAESSTPLQRQPRLWLEPLAENGEQNAVDYVVKMHRFRAFALLYDRLFKGWLTANEVYALGERVAAFHVNQPLEPVPPEGNHANFRENFSGLCGSYAQKVQSPRASSIIGDLDVLGLHAIEDAKERLDARNNSWHLLHGDLDFGNIASFNDALMPFDAQVLFDGKRANDPAKDVAYMLAPLYMYEKPELARALLDGYQNVANDPTLEDVLPLWVAYASIVRGGSWLSRVNALKNTPEGNQKEACAYRFLQVARLLLDGRMTLR